MIPIFKYEKENGLSDIIQSTSSIAYTSSIQSVDVDVDELKKLKSILKSSASANPDQFDLYYLESILASAGWNKNDDVFDRIELWNARNTAVDKQFNFMHNERDIIGHLTSAKAVDCDGKILSDSTDVKDLPNQFDIAVGSVLYRKWADPNLQERMNKIIAQIVENKWCVSMECLFKNFDYAITYNDNNGGEIQKIVARNDTTSFLTKYLRVYGGVGEYKGYRIGRLLRSFSFSGKGLVDNPANPRSHITSFSDSSEKSSFAGIFATAEELNISNEEKIMTTEFVYTKEQYEALKAELDQIKAVSKDATQKEIDALKSQVAELSKANKQLNDELEASKEVSKAKEDKLVALETSLSEAQAKLTEVENSMKEAELKALANMRKQLLLDRVDEEKAENLVQKFANASQEMFDALLESLPVRAKCEDKKEKDKDKEKNKEKEAKAEEIESNIEEAKAEEELEMSSGGTQEEETLRSKAASWFSGVLRTTAKEKNN
jgi:hypothetical protein